MAKKQTERLDKRVHESYPHLTRNQIQSFIMQGNVFVNGKPETKPGTPIHHDALVLLTVEEPKFVSRAGFKLEAALDYFELDVSGLVAMDAGISTGGFTDCLLQKGIKRVYGIDVGYGQVHEKVAQDPRVIVLERTNLRHLESLPEPVDLVTLDLSFISIIKVIPTIKRILKSGGSLITLIKPQFEADRKDIKKGGVVRDSEVHQKVIEKIKNGLTHEGFTIIGVIDSPIVGASAGNKEFLALFAFKTK